MTPPCKRCICLGMCLQKLRQDEEHAEYPHFNISHANVTKKIIDECSILKIYLLKRKRDWTKTLEYTPKDMYAFCDFCQKKIYEIRDGGT